MMNRLSFLLILPVLLVACATPPQPLPSQTRIENLVIGPSLSRSIQPVSMIQGRTPGGQLEMQAQLSNRGRRARTLRHQVTWFDEAGLILGTPVWSTRLVQPRETFEIRIISPHADAASGRLHITD